MKNLGLVIALVGLAIIAGCFFLTPPHSLNPADSESGIHASAMATYGGFIVFGVGIVMYISSLPFANEKK
ncbi:hypothetical protein ACFQZS_02240 [Mucilaginibacter calamicampi]|uniref:Uncharacterized protein n=1 Tax=Mucilaginibacter calamicampi TaxID=1302352 RepID=A0ABW2YRB6_9SPHI